LIFEKCNITKNSVEALTFEAQIFRNEIVKKNRINDTFLRLKRLAIYCSVNLKNDGMDIVVIFFEYITIEHIELEFIKLNDEMV
jgi:hypothetical protein